MLASLAARLPLNLSRQDRLSGALIVMWVASMISLPILRWVGGDPIVPTGVAVTVIIQSAAVASVLARAWGWRHTLLTLVAVAALGWLVEFTGSTTGFPFGQYHYTDRLQPQINGVPLVIPFAWFMMLPPAWAVAHRLIGVKRRLAFVALSALAFTAWDLFLDPQMAGWGFWVWADPDGYFGIPWINFGGWITASALITLLVQPSKLPVRPLLIIYTITWALMTIGLLVFWGLPGPALAGGAAMGSLVALAWRAELRGETV